LHGQHDQWNLVSIERIAQFRSNGFGTQLSDVSPLCEVPAGNRRDRVFMVGEKDELHRYTTVRFLAPNARLQLERNAQTQRAAAMTAATHDAHIGMSELPITIGVLVSARAT
jgi:hypothetical protein